MSNGEDERQSDVGATNDTNEQLDKDIHLDRSPRVRSKTNQEDGSKIWKSKNNKADDNDPCISSGDICRICHMGGFPLPGDNRGTWEWQNQGVRRDDSQISTISAYAYLGPLISACKCRGTVALVHAECLERWLTESGHTSCELCGYKYTTKMVPRHNILRSIVIWFYTVIATRQMMLDVLYLVVTTPLAMFSCYICALAFKLILERGLHEMPWMIIAMLPTCSLTLIAYWGWLITLARLHGRRWRRYWRNNFVVRLMPDNASEEEDQWNGRMAEGRDREEDEFERWGNDEAEEFVQIL